MVAVVERFEASFAASWDAAKKGAGCLAVACARQVKSEISLVLGEDVGVFLWDFCASGV